jgi:hypothetical protein
MAGSLRSVCYDGRVEAQLGPLLKLSSAEYYKIVTARWDCCKGAVETPCLFQTSFGEKAIKETNEENVPIEVISANGTKASLSCKA